MKKTILLIAFIATMTAAHAGGTPSKTIQTPAWMKPGGAFDATVSYWINWFGATRN